MDKQATIQVRVERSVKNEAEKIFDMLGMSLSEAIRIFVSQVIRERSFPFTPHLKKDTKGTQAFGKLHHYCKDQPSTYDVVAPKVFVPPKYTEKHSGDNARMILLDSTVIEHYLLNDDPNFSKKAWKMVATGTAIIYPESISEAVNILNEEYGVPRSLLGTVMQMLLDDVMVENEALVRVALGFFANTHLSFRRSLLMAHSALTGCEIETFDKAFSKAII